MKLIRYILRMIGFFSTLIIGTIIALLIGWIPVGSNGARLAQKIAAQMSKMALAILDVKITVDRPDLLRQHSGFIFSNHSSYMDIMVMMATEPVRFVAKSEVRRMLFIGRLAWTIGCIFVKREKKQSRQAARSTLGRLDSYKPAVVLFPEGTTAPIGQLLPYRKGAFEIAKEAGINYLPVSIVYSNLTLIDWRSVPFSQALWNIMSRNSTLHANLYVHDPVTPTPDDDAQALCDQTRQEMLHVLTTKGNYRPETSEEPAYALQSV